MTPHHPIRRRAARWLGLVVLLGAAVVAPAPALAQGESDPDLDQTLERDQPIVTGEAVLTDGHVDIGPRLVDDEFALLVHDDTVIPSVWRDLDETVLAVTDDALQTVPDDPTYSFLGVEPGSEVHVVPQVQRPGVVWVGWNTQDPELMERIDRGATLSLLGVEGPGEVTMYIQSGSLGDPEVLWQSTTRERQPIWVEVNTHTHANWVFTEPGSYLVQVEIAVDLVTGETVTDERTLRFAVGDDTDPQEVLQATYTTPRPDEAAAEGAGGDASPADEVTDDDGGVPVLAGLAVLALVLGAVVAVVVVRGAGAKKRAEADRVSAGESR